MRNLIEPIKKCCIRQYKKISEHIKFIVKPEVVVLDGVRYSGFWPGFNPENFFLHEMLRERQPDTQVVGPFPGYSIYSDLFSTLIWGRADFFITGENRNMRWTRAKRQIGFWMNVDEEVAENVHRFPYWLWNVDWGEAAPQIDTSRYGEPLCLQSLNSPIIERFSVDSLRRRSASIVIIASSMDGNRKHLVELLQRYFEVVKFGSAFGQEGRVKNKAALLRQYQFCLCPENSLGDGYITEKIPEAFQAGCIPITWCDPAGSSHDFNTNAFINLATMTESESIEAICEVINRGALYEEMIRVPLLKNTPSLEGLRSFVLNK